MGQNCDDVRQEFVLLSDVLGVSMLMELMNSTPKAKAKTSDRISDAVSPTEGTVLGPFHMTESPRRAFGDFISDIYGNNPLVVEVSVQSTNGDLIPNADIDVWQCNSKGFYDVQQPDIQPSGNGRGLFTANDKGEIKFVTIVPSYYPIPTDGPVGSLLEATGRHPFRPAHIHFIVKAIGYRSLTTHIFMPDSPYLDSDAVFAVKKSLICDIEQVDDIHEAELLRVSNPFQRTRIQLVMDGADS